MQTDDPLCDDVPRKPRLGVITDEPDSAYHHSGCWGHTALAAYLRSPAGFKMRYVDRLPDAQWGGSTSTVIGSGVHAYRQSPRVYAEQFVRPPPTLKLSIDGKLSTKEAKEWVAQQTLARKRVVTAEDDRTIRLTACMLRKNPTCRRLLHATEAEVTVRWIDEETSLPLQIRIDVLKRGVHLSDIKTTHDSVADFWRSVMKYGYDIQAGLYSHGWKVVTGESLPFYFLVTQTVFPFETKAYVMPNALVARGLDRARVAIRGVASGDFGSVQETVEELAMPEWWLRREGLSVGNDGRVEARFAEFA